MEIRFNLSGTIELPDGSVVEGPRTVRLPNGDCIKLWTAVELNEERDLDFKEMQLMGIDVSDEAEIKESV